MTSQNCRRVRIRLLGCPRRVDRPEQCTWVGVQLRPPSSPKSPFSSKAYAAAQGKSRGESERTIEPRVLLAFARKLAVR
ncbi:MAG: hypothetical protein ACK56Q_11815 [Pirellulaceae bacterium]